MKHLPADRTREVGTVITNYDHTIDEAVSRDMVAPDAFATYPAWDWFGRVWVDGEQFHVEALRHGFPIGSVSACTLKDLMAKACEAWGAD